MHRAQNYSLYLHDALPIFDHIERGKLDLAGLRIVVLDEADRLLDMGFAPEVRRLLAKCPQDRQTADLGRETHVQEDRKSTRLNSSHRTISYAVFCLENKKS